MKRIITALGLSLLLAAPAFALDLASARSQGLVGEKRTGYVAAISGTPEVQALVSDVNAKRTQEYQRISKENGQPVDVVGKLAAEQVISKLPAGAMYEGASGGWVKK